MTAVKAYYDGKVFIPMSPTGTAESHAATATVLDDIPETNGSGDYPQFAGALPDKDYREVTAILESTEKIDKNG
jgi:hypothetical protein